MTHLGTLVGIDPGSTNLGVAVLTIDLETLAIVSTYAFTVHADKSPYYEWMSEYHPDRVQRIRALEEILYQTFLRYQPLQVWSESPFYNRFRPNAYGVLVEVLECIRRAVFQYHPTLPLMTIDPPSVKKALGASSKAKKDAVALALSEMTALKLTVPLAQLDEHAVDAIGVVYGGYRNLLGGIHA